jgi:sporulation protein YlmC with PRC-barrel domain
MQEMSFAAHLNQTSFQALDNYPKRNERNTTMTTGLTLSASSLRGDSVKNPQGEDIGDIKDIMIDTATGRVEYYVLSFGGFLGMGKKLFAVPPQALQVDTNNECMVLDIPKEKLEKAPGFDEDNWPNTANDNTFRDEVYSYYGYKYQNAA